MEPLHRVTPTERLTWGRGGGWYFALLLTFRSAGAIAIPTLNAERKTRFTFRTAGAIAITTLNAER